MDYKEFKEIATQCFNFFRYNFQCIVEIESLKFFKRSYQIKLDDSVLCVTVAFLESLSESFNSPYVSVVYDDGLSIMINFK